MIRVSRRSALRTIGATGAALAGTALLNAACEPIPAPAAVSKVVGISDRPMESQKFTGPGWYAFGYDEPGFYKCAYYAEPDRGGYLPGFIDLSQGPGHPVQISISPRGFDESCIGICLTPEQADRAARGMAR
jgi:hypothetical protein